MHLPDEEFPGNVSRLKVPQYMSRLAFSLKLSHEMTMSAIYEYLASVVHSKHNASI